MRAKSVSRPSRVYHRCCRQFSRAPTTGAHQVQTGGHCLPSSSRHCTSVLVRSAAVRRWSTHETSRPAALVDLQPSLRPPVAACLCRRSHFCCCWRTTLKQSTCWRLVCPGHYSQHFVTNWKHIHFGNHSTQTLFSSCVAMVVREVTFT